MGKESQIAGFRKANLIFNERMAAVIPAYNEGRSIEEVVCQVKKRALAIVVDDGSTDDTAMRATSAGAFVVSHPFNQGYDAALATGIRTAIELGCVFAVTLDADGQHDPFLLNRFSDELESGVDLVIGVRDETQRWSEKLFCFVGGQLWGIYDPLCGMKGYRLQILGKVKSLNTYPSVGTEIAIRAVKAGVKISQLSICTRPRDGDSRFGIGFKANMRIMKALWLGFLCAQQLTLPDSVD